MLQVNSVRVMVVLTLVLVIFFGFETASLAQTKVSIKKADTGKSRGEIQKQVMDFEADVALSGHALSIAEMVETGTVKCELGNSIEVTAASRMSGYFDIRGNKFRFHMVPVVASTGAMRLEDVGMGLCGCNWPINP